MVRHFTLLARLGILVAALSIGCRDPQEPVRTDAAPLVARLDIPTPTSVHWRVVPLYPDSSWVPGPTDFDDVYAYIELSPAEWSSEKGKAMLTAETASVALSEDAARGLLPPGVVAKSRVEKSQRVVDGARLTVPVLREHLRVLSAVRVGDAIVLGVRIGR